MRKKPRPTDENRQAARRGIGMRPQRGDEKIAADVCRVGLDRPVIAAVEISR
jgi:hypothetical protein